MQSGSPCAVVTTSGTAVAELLPAVIEAHYQRRPLLVISADRPVRFRGTGAPQAIEQAGIFENYVEGVEDIEWKDDITLFDGWSGLAPWQMNICLEENEVGTDENVRMSKMRLGELNDARPKSKWA